MTASLAVFSGVLKSTRSAATKSLGGTGVTVLILVVAAALTAFINVVVFNTLSELAGPLIDPASPLPAAERNALLSNFLVSILLLGSMFSLIFSMLVPAKSNISLAARIHGASRVAIGAGETLALFVLTTTAVLAVQIGIFWFVASGQDTPVLSLVTMLLTGVAFGALTLIIKSVVSIVGGLLRLNDELGRILSLLIAMGLVLGAIAEVSVAALNGYRSAIQTAASTLWLGQTVPSGVGPLLLVGVASVVLVAALMLIQGNSANTSSLHTGSRFVTLPAPRNPAALGSFITRELLITLRHPTSQVSFICLALILVGMIIGTRGGFIPAGAAAYGLVFFCALGGEVAYGRTKPFHWLYTMANYPAAKVMGAKFIAVFVVQLVLLLIAVVAAVPADLIGPILARSLPLLVSLSAVTFFCGTLLPYSEAAPLSLAGTAILVIILDAGLLLLDSYLVSAPALLSIGAHLLVGLIALVLSVTVDKQRSLA